MLKQRLSSDIEDDPHNFSIDIVEQFVSCKLQKFKNTFLYESIKKDKLLPVYYLRTNF